MEDQAKYGQEAQSVMTAKILQKLQELLDEESNSDVHISTVDLYDPEKAQLFFHTLSTVAPCIIYNRLTGSKKNLLEYNHYTNYLVQKFSKYRAALKAAEEIEKMKLNKE